MISSTIYELPGPRELNVREEQLDLSLLADDAIAASTICSVISPGTEIAAYTGQPPLKPGKVYPRVVGYCNVAEVVATGKDVADLKPGQRIATFQSHRSAFICPRSDVIARVESDINPVHAAATYLFHLGYHALLKVNAKAGLNVAVIGLGTLGLGAVAAATLLGCRTVGLSAQTSLRQTAESVGADAALDKGDSSAVDKVAEWAGEAGIGIVVITSNGWDDWRTALTLARTGGTISVLGFPGRGQPPPDFNPLDSQYLYAKQLTITADVLPHQTQVRQDEAPFELDKTYGYLLDQIRQGRLPVGSLVTEEADWRDLGKIYERMANRESGLLSAALNWT